MIVNKKKQQQRPRGAQVVVIKNDADNTCPFKIQFHPMQRESSIFHPLVGFIIQFYTLNSMRLNHHP